MPATIIRGKPIENQRTRCLTFKQVFHSQREKSASNKKKIPFYRLESYSSINLCSAKSNPEASQRSRVRRCRSDPSNGTRKGPSVPLPRDSFYFEGEITQFPVRVCCLSSRSEQTRSAVCVHTCVCLWGGSFGLRAPPPPSGVQQRQLVR